MTLQRILVPIDGSDGAARALILADELAEKTEGELTLLQVIEEEDPLPSFWDRVPEGVDRVDYLADQRYRAIESTLTSLRARYERRVEQGYAAEVICKVAEQDAFDLIVIGRRGLTPVTRFMLGSTSDRVVHHAPCAVLVAR
ncbi:MAG: universal stress protein [Polyangiaceae bacterium]|nr:universal stress protein [Polyangiaceae bacterium]